jgi:DDE superfamily endonuclease
MNVNTLNEFRHAMYSCLERAGDALFNTVDALSSETAAHSFPELSQSPFFARKWPSLYEALEDGKISAKRLREVMVEFAPLPQASSCVFVGVDTSDLYRKEAETVADRTMVPIPNLPDCDHAVCPGLVISSVVLLPNEPGQGTWVLDSRRVTSQDVATGVAADQLREVVFLLVKKGMRPIILGDRWYACAPFLKGMAEVCASCLLRVKRNRVFYRPAPPRQPGQRGASRKDGARFQCCDESTHGEPEGTWEGTDAKGRRVEVRCWNRLHLRQAREIEVSVVQVLRHGAEGSRRDPGVSWFVWKGDQPAPLAEISPTYRLRYSHEHGFRLDKQVLLWDQPRLRTAEQTERWTQVVACAHNQLVAARPLLEGVYRPWEHRRSVLTLSQVRRAMPTLLRQLGTPARPPQPRGKALGRPKGFHPQPALRYPVIRKTSKKGKKRKKAAAA